MLRDARLIAGKDLRIELRSRVVTTQVLPFGLMVLFLLCRIGTGYVSARRFGDARVVRLWIDYAVLTAALGLGAAWLPGVLP